MTASERACMRALAPILLPKSDTAMQSARAGAPRSGTTTIVTLVGQTYGMLYPTGGGVLVGMSASVFLMADDFLRQVDPRRAMLVIPCSAAKTRGGQPPGPGAGPGLM